MAQLLNQRFLVLHVVASPLVKRSSGDNFAFPNAYAPHPALRASMGVPSNGAKLELVYVAGPCNKCAHTPGSA